MSEHCREQRPLLCEDLLEEEPFSPQYYRRIRPRSYRGRVRNNLQGAAAILKSWPDHWSSFLVYLWIGIGMISLSTFIIYNSLFALPILPSVNLKPTSVIIPKENEKNAVKSPQLPDVYMHIFVDPSEDIELNQYIPYIEILANAFLDFKFNFIVIVNDTNVGWMGAEENNELALNALWINHKNTIETATRNHNINIEQVTLAAYMDSSPLRKYWRILPNQLIEFLVRAISIWDKGGIAVKPDILTPRFQNTLYIEKLQKILNKYGHTNKDINFSKNIAEIPNKKTQKKYRKLNNIRDIIEALENENMSANSFDQQTLTEAENKDATIIRQDRHAFTKNVKGKSSEANKEPLIKKQDYILDKNNTVEMKFANSTESPETLKHDSNLYKKSLLPLFLEFLFNRRDDVSSKSPETFVTNRIRKSVLVETSSEKNISILNKDEKSNTKKHFKNSYMPVVHISAPNIHNTSVYDKIKIPNNRDTIIDNLESNKLTIDLQGNIIATDTPCHAFLGTVFSNVIHHSEEESISDFIIAELTLFCKGLLSSCTGIDLILL